MKPTFTQGEIDFFISVLNYHKPLVERLQNLPPHEILVICGYLAGTLSAQLPASPAAFVESLNLFKAIHTDLVPSDYEPDGSLLWVFPATEDPVTERPSIVPSLLS